jgi:triosephosphate isomerase
MAKTNLESQQLVQEIIEKMPKTKNDVVICPSFLALPQTVSQTEGTQVKVGAQTMHYEDKGPYTGEVSAKMLTEIGVKYVIIGHSSRRSDDNETDAKINKKIKKAVESGLIPILCVGESSKERELGRTYRVIKRQLQRDLEGIEDATSIIVAYEPLWAISDGINPAPTPTIEEIGAVNSGIKRVLRQIFGKEQVKQMRILYGGSVTPENAGEIMADRSVNGVLVGGASLNADKFIGIVNSAIKK